MSRSSACIGIDVGGPKKGFHAVAIGARSGLQQFASVDAAAVAHWCRSLHALLIAIDAPCRWRGRGGVRSAERSLAAAGFRCFWTPTRAAATGHPTGYYDWMLAGERLYQALAQSHPLLSQWPWNAGPGCFETFPHAAACRLAGRMLDVRRKRPLRLAALESCGVDVRSLETQDAIDAAVAAMVAHRAATGHAEAMGDSRDGFIVLPWTPPRGASPTLART